MHIEKYRLTMEIVEISKALANDTRVNILQWLKNPDESFKEFYQDEDFNETGVCVSLIKEKCGLCQSTVSQYLSTLQKVDFLTIKRIGQWTYYKRNEKTIEDFQNSLDKMI